MRDISWRPRASADLEGILVYIGMELGSPQAARLTAEAIFAAVERAAQFPEAGRLLSDDDLKRSYRRVLAKSYWVYYSYTAETLTVHRVFHTLRDLDHYGFEVLDD